MKLCPAQSTMMEVAPGVSPLSMRIIAFLVRTMLVVFCPCTVMRFVSFRSADTNEGRRQSKHPSPMNFIRLLNLTLLGLSCILRVVNLRRELRYVAMDKNRFWCSIPLGESLHL